MNCQKKNVECTNPEEGKCNGIFLEATGALLSGWYDTAMKIVKRNMWSTQNPVEGKCNGIFLGATGALLSLWHGTAMKIQKKYVEYTKPCGRQV